MFRNVPARLFAIPFFALSCFGQAPPGFDAASIRAAQEGRTQILTSPGTLTMRNVNLLDIVSWAYDIAHLQISGPDWMRATRFDLIAKAEGGGGDDDRLRLMLCRLLADRFAFSSHFEQKEMKAYVLTLEKDGPKFKESTDDGPPEFTNAGRGMLVAHRATMPELADKLSDPLRSPVIDQTGLKGKYEIRIDITGFIAAAGDNGPNQDEVLSILFNAIPAQLGVKLESKKENVKLLVVDHMEQQPTAN
ncbi:MAG TPA: TIGR03435 family protein [Bryobacteraceae bacterium]|nr:TIGR03435 family protein [Bryobacteraceae bacterium]